MTAEKALQIRPNFDTTDNRMTMKEGVTDGILDAEIILALKFLDHADHCSTTFQHLKLAIQMKRPDLSLCMIPPTL
jgi:hypothetical protein